MDSMYSTFSGQSSLGILELDNMSGNYNYWSINYKYFKIS